MVHSYHPKFSGGIGDFLRGSIYLSNICHKENIDFYIDWKPHIMGKFLSNPRTVPDYDSEYVLDIEEITLKKIKQEKLTQQPLNILCKNTIDDIIKEQKKLPEETLAISSFYLDIDYENARQSIKDYDIPLHSKMLLQKSLRPHINIKNAYKKNIGNKDHYGTIHFRLGDRQTLPNINQCLDNIPQSIKNNSNLRCVEPDFEFIYFLIKRNLKQNNLDYIVLLSDSNELKKYIAKENNNKIIIPHYNSNHSCQSPGLLKYTKAYSHDFSYDQARWGALDLEILINSQKNISYSIYQWGSGFSVWPSKIFDIPIEIRELPSVE